MSKIKGFRVNNENVRYQDENIANEYSTTSTYASGNYVMYEGQLYKNNTAVTSAGPWESNSSNFTLTTIGQNLSQLRTDLDILNAGGLVIEEELVKDEIDTWLAANPSYTTTVQDNSLTTAKYQNGSITESKLEPILLGKINARTLYITPQMFGAVGDGVEDDTEAFTAMASAINGDDGIHDIVIPEGIYALSGDVEITKDCNIIGYGAELVFSGDHGLYVLGTYEVIGKNSAAASIHATTLATDYLSETDPNKIYILYDITDNSWSTERAYYRRGEFLKVAKNNAGTFYLERPLDDLYPTNCRIIEANPITVSIEGIKFTSINSTTSHIGIVSVMFGKNCLVKNCKFEGSPHLQISYNNCCDSRIENCEGKSVGGSNEGLNYGVSILSSDNIIVSDCSFITWRHGFTVGNGKYPVPSRYIEFLRCKAIAYAHIDAAINGTTQEEGVTGFDAHANSEFITWKDCEGDSIGNDASNCVLDGCTFAAIGSYCPIYGWYQVRGYYKIKNCKIYGWNGTTSIYYDCRVRRSDIDPDFNLIIEDSYIEKAVSITFESVVTYKKWVDVINSKLPSGIKINRSYPVEKMMVIGNEADYLDFGLSYGGEHIVKNNRCGYIEVSGGSTSYRTNAIVEGNRVYKHSSAKSPIQVGHVYEGIVTDNIIDLTLVSNVSGFVQAVDAVFLIITGNIFNVNKNGKTVTVELIDHRTPGVKLLSTNNIWYVDGELVDYTPTT